MRVVIFNWRGPHSLKSGGAEHETHVLASGLCRRGHSVLWFTSRSGDEPATENRGYEIRRAGSELTCRFHAAAWLRRNRDSIDVIIDEVNTLPFFSAFIAKDRVILWMHQLAREVWTAEAPPVIGLIGRLLERRLLSMYATVPVVTGAASSVRSFTSVGLRGPVQVVEYALPPPFLTPSSPARNLLGYVGRIARSKRIDHIVRALAYVKESVPDARLSIVGSGDRREIARLQTLVRRLRLDDSVVMHGRVPEEERDAIMSSFDLLCMASLREGWGLVVSEAARFGVPSVVDPVDGLVDSVVDGQTGVVVRSEEPPALAQGIVKVLQNRALRDELGRGAMRYIAPFSEDRFVGKFEEVLLARAHSLSRGMA